MLVAAVYSRQSFSVMLTVFLAHLRARADSRRATVLLKRRRST